VYKGTVDVRHWYGGIGGDEVDGCSFSEMNRSARLEDEMLRDGHTWSLVAVEACSRLERKARQGTANPCVIDSQMLSTIMLSSSSICRSAVL
jgi:hypothetical protein